MTENILIVINIIAFLFIALEIYLLHRNDKKTRKSTEENAKELIREFLKSNKN